MRFIDASVFLYAFLKPKRPLPRQIVELKENAKKIVSRIDGGERVVTTVVHISEIANIVEAKASQLLAATVVEALLSKENIIVYPVAPGDYIAAVEIARTYRIGVNDAVAILYMKAEDIDEIYSFDKDFDKVPGITRITS